VPLPPVLSIRVIHLVWAPLGPRMLEGFLAAWREQTPGHPASLTVVMNGFESRAGAAPALALLDGVGADLVWAPEPVQDLAAYPLAASEAEEPFVCLMNSYARPLRPGWLAALAGATEGRPLAAAGATGSWESHGTEFSLRARLSAGSARDRIGGVVDWLSFHRRFPPFPNPHLRTNGLLYPRELLLDVLKRPPRTKDEAFALESGRAGLSRRIVDEGGELLVVTRDGRAHSPVQWPATHTFRSGELDGLLIADNRTEDWMRAGPQERAALSRRAWGERSGDT
jgi:hypothetical protein